MTGVSELDAMKSIDNALSGVSDPLTRDRILKWAWAKFSSTPSSLLGDENPKKKAKGKAPKKGAKGPAKSKTSRTMLKTLNLTPSGKISFKDFVGEKQPSSNLERCVVAVHYVANILQEASVTADHVFTCFKIQHWRLPADIDNTLQYVASQKGWLDTANMSDIKLTTHGDNLIEHELPTGKRGGK